MIRSLYAVPAMFCLSAALLTAQAPAGDKPATNPPGAQQPSGESTTPKPSSPSTSSAASAGKVTYTGCVKPGTSADSWVLENAEAARQPQSRSHRIVEVRQRVVVEQHGSCRRGWGSRSVTVGCKLSIGTDLQC